MRVLITWIGNADREAYLGGAERLKDDLGPVLRLLRQERFDRIHLLNDLEDLDFAAFGRWLARQAGIEEDRLIKHPAPENLRNDYDRAYDFTIKVVREVRRKYSAETSFAVLLSPGNASKQVAMLLAAHVEFGAKGVEALTTSREQGVERLRLPYRVQVDAVPRALQHLSQELEKVAVSADFDEILGESRALQAAKKKAQVVAEYDSAVILLGETGTGKELFARAIHAASRRKNEKLVTVHVAGLTETLLESELFGHKKGAFTDAKEDRRGFVEEAHGGTLFLDEVGDIPLRAQVKLLRFLESGQFSRVGESTETKADVRVIAATNKDLEKGMAEGWFREDFYARLATVTIVLPPLRERGGDVELLARHFLKEFNSTYSRNVAFDEDAIRVLCGAPWPRNVRQLRQTVENLAVFAIDDKITAEAAEAAVNDQRRSAGRRLCEMGPREFAAHLVAVVDELLDRFRTEGKLPWSFAADSDMVEQLLEPLLCGRALVMEDGVWERAGKRYRKSGLDRSKPAHNERYRSYEELMKWGDERAIAQARGK